jgi:hypothetical protein
MAQICHRRDCRGRFRNGSPTSLAVSNFAGKRSLDTEPLPLGRVQDVAFDGEDLF